MVVVGAMMIVIFALVVSLITWYIQYLIYTDDVCSCFIPISILIPLTGSIGLLIGTAAYYTFSPKFEKKIDKNILLGLFNVDEASIMKCIIENKGYVSQSKIVNSTNMSKVKVYRILEKLRKKGIIKKISKGKTNMIVLNKELNSALE